MEDELAAGKEIDESRLRSAEAAAAAGACADVVLEEDQAQEMMEHMRVAACLAGVADNKSPSVAGPVDTPQRSPCESASENAEAGGEAPRVALEAEYLVPDSHGYVASALHICLEGQPIGQAHALCAHLMVRFWRQETCACRIVGGWSHRHPRSSRRSSGLSMTIAQRLHRNSSTSTGRRAFAPTFQPGGSQPMSAGC